MPGPPSIEVADGLQARRRVCDFAAAAACRTTTSSAAAARRASNHHPEEQEEAQCLMMGITCGYSPKPLNMKMSQRCVKNLSQGGCSFFTIFVSECTIFFESFSIKALLVTSMTGLNSLVYSFRTDKMRLPFQLQRLQMRQSLLV